MFLKKNLAARTSDLLWGRSVDLSKTYFVGNCYIQSNIKPYYSKYYNSVLINGGKVGPSGRAV